MEKNLLYHMKTLALTSLVYSFLCEFLWKNGIYDIFMEKFKREHDMSLHQWIYIYYIRVSSKSVFVDKEDSPFRPSISWDDDTLPRRYWVYYHFKYIAEFKQSLLINIASKIGLP